MEIILRKTTCKNIVGFNMHKFNKSAKKVSPLINFGFTQNILKQSSCSLSAINWTLEQIDQVNSLKEFKEGWGKVGFLKLYKITQKFEYSQLFKLCFNICCFIAEKKNRAKSLTLPLGTAQYSPIFL